MPSGVIAIADGRPPTLIVLMTLPVRVLNAVTVPEPSFTT